ncbi:MAG: class I poly(R)-hydroxyalkanoic acid synthase [Alphaproteobacteria bacterium]|nr:class I poly(R)-hydroxyalkanoic acid synthase [Alphaproteobacteria bacterium]
MSSQHQQSETGKIPAGTWSYTAEGSQRIMQQMTVSPAGTTSAQNLAPIVAAFTAMTQRLMADPAQLAKAQIKFCQLQISLWQNTVERMLGQAPDDNTETIAPAPDDHRFRHPAWQKNLVFETIKKSYLLSARYLQGIVEGIDDLDPETARKVDFYTRQFVDAMAPTNFAATNPAVIEAIVDSNGDNLVRGLYNMLADLERGGGELKISMTDDDAFEIGRNIAATPGQVVFRNELMELIQYQPTTETVRQRPLLVVPPWINKFYVLDLRPQNSLLKWATDQGYTVFAISWVNPGPEFADKNFEDYMREGPLEALDAIEQATGEREVVAASLCLGGTLLASTLGYLAAIGDERIRSAMFMASLFDFSEPGDLGVFIDDTQIAALEKRMEEQGGMLDGSAMSTAFNMLRAKDLIWSFVVNNYLLGKDPAPFDLLYWNADSTRMPATMHAFYLRNMYQKNLLVQPGGITLSGQQIDLGAISVPAYLLAAKEDHIAPWKSCYSGVHCYGGPVRFVLTGSGHIAGVTNAPAIAKYPHWTNTKKPKDSETWLEGAVQQNGSWWQDWHKWQSRHAGPMVAARTPGDRALQPLCPAPGTYVIQKER